MNYIKKVVNEIKEAKSDIEIKKVLLDIYFTIQMDSAIRKEFEDCYESIKYY